MQRGGRFVRRLHAITVIDVAGYSRLMSSEESQTHARVNELFETVVKPNVRMHGGRDIERAGDGLLVLFESSTAALTSALGVQRAVAEHQLSAAVGRRLLLRIGINVGDIIIDGDEIAGDDVNVAARLQALASPGTICMSAAVHEQVHEALDCTYTDRGLVELKNIGRPIRVYEARPAEPAARGPQLKRLLGRWRVQWGGARRGLSRVWPPGLAAAVLVGAAWWSMRGPEASPPPMSIAVLPFKSALGDDVHPLATELTGMVTRRLAATSWIVVAAPDVVERFAGQASGTDSVRRGLNVRYALSGRIRANAGKLVIDAELADTGTGVALWTGHASADRRDATPETNLIGNIVVQLREAIYGAEAKRLLDSGAAPRTPMEHKMLGDEQRDKFIALDSERKARVHYERALASDPHFEPAIVAAAYMLLAELDLDPAVSPKQVLDQADALAKRAVSRAPGSAPAWQLRSEVLARQWLWDAALDASDQALALDPGRSFAFSQHASLLIRIGKPREALVFADRALALAEQRSGYALFQRCRALMALARFADSAEACEKSLAREEWWLQRAYLLAAYALLGQADKVIAERERLFAQLPGFTLARIHALRLSNVREFEDQADASLLRGLRLAGIAERR